MDKTIMLAGLIFISLPVVVLTLMIGMIMNDDRNNKGQSDIDLDMRLYIPSWCRDRSSNHRCNKQDEGENK